MIIVGITGSVGMGKSTATKMLRDFGYDVFDADKCVSALLKNKNIIEEIAKNFPEAVQDGSFLNTDVLRSIVFMNSDRLNVLEKIVHPAVMFECRAFAAEKKEQGKDIVFLDIPLLFEIGADKETDYTIIVSAPGFVQKKRVLRRPGMTEKYFEFIRSRQIPDKEKRRRSDYVVYSCFGFTVMRVMLKIIVVNIIAKGVKKEKTA